MWGLAADHRSEAEDRIEASRTGQGPSRERNFKGAGHAHHLERVVNRPGVLQCLHGRRKQSTRDEFIKFTDDDAEAEPGRIVRPFAKLHEEMVGGVPVGRGLYLLQDVPEFVFLRA